MGRGSNFKHVQKRIEDVGESGRSKNVARTWCGSSGNVMKAQ